MKSGKLEMAPTNYGSMAKPFEALRIAADFFPGYFDADQLYLLKEDPTEQRNVAEQNAGLLAEMKEKMRKQLASLPQPYPLDDAEQLAFLRSEMFRQLAAKRQAQGVADVPWWPGALERFHRQFLPLVCG